MAGSHLLHVKLQFGDTQNKQLEYRLEVLVVEKDMKIVRNI